MLKKTAIALSFLVALAGTDVALAETSPTSSTSSLTLEAAFEGAPLQVAALSAKEMHDTLGAWIPQAVGAFGGAVGYGFNCGIVGNCSWPGLAFSAGVGALNPISGVWGFNSAIGAGIAQGVGSVYGLW